MNQSTQNLITQAFNSSTYIQNTVDVQHTPLYDTITVAAGGSLATGTKFFDVVTGKTLADTNMQISQRLTAPEAFSIQAIRVRWRENILRADLDLLLDGFALEFWLGSKQYQRAPLWHFNAGGGVAGFAATTAAATTLQSLSNGQPARQAMHRLAIPIVIENQMNFYCQLVGTSSITIAAGGAGGTGLRLQVLLDGFYARGVQ